MQVSETGADGLKREFTVVVPASDLEDKLVSRLAEIGQTIQLPGFRPGKVPASLLRKRYGDSIRGEVLESTIQESWQQALTEKELRPAGEPKVEIVTSEEGADLEFKLNVELMPEIDPVDFSTIDLVRRVTKVDDEAIDGALQRIAESRKAFEPVGDGRAARDGDQVVLDFDGKVDGEAFAGGEMKDFQLELGAGGFLPGFEEQIVGMKGGDEKKIKVTMPDDHANDKLQGKDINFEVTLKEVRETKVVAIDDALAEGAGMENLDALKSAIREELEREYAQLSRALLKRELLDRLAEGPEFELPGSMLEAEFEGIWKQLSDARERDTLDDDDKDLSEDDLKERYRKIAARRVRLGLMLADVGRTNNITVTQDDLNRAINREASRMPGQEAMVIEYFQKNAQAKQELQAPIFEDKVIDFVLEIANVTNQDVTLDELTRDPDEKPAGKETEKGAKKIPKKGQGKAKKAKEKAKEKTKSKAESD